MGMCKIDETYWNWHAHDSHLVQILNDNHIFDLSWQEVVGFKRTDQEIESS